jgi:hypothetical protein
MNKEELIYLMYEVWVTHSDLHNDLWLTDDVFDKHFPSRAPWPKFMFKLNRLDVKRSNKGSQYQYHHNRIYYIMKGHYQGPDSAVGYYIV